MSKLHSGHIESAVVKLLNYRVYTIVPNVSFGLGLGHECDLLCLDRNGRFMEIEIKISAADLKADFKKEHGHQSKHIGRLVYAMPLVLCEKYKDIIPERCGIISCDFSPHYKWGAKELMYETYDAIWFRQCKHNKDTINPDDKMVKKFMSLGCMRIWSLKSHNNGKIKREQSHLLK